MKNFVLLRYLADVPLARCLVLLVFDLFYKKYQICMTKIICILFVGNDALVVPLPDRNTIIVGAGLASAQINIGVILIKGRRKACPYTISINPTNNHTNYNNVFNVSYKGMFLNKEKECQM